MEDQAVKVLIEIQRSLQVIAGALAKAPNMHKSLADYSAFDWGSIGAQVLRSDNDGVSIVEHNGRVYKRRAPDNKFEACIWFSRCTGKAADGSNEYETLISFEVIKDDVGPLGSKARQALLSSRKSQDRPAVPTKSAVTRTTTSNVSSIQTSRLSDDELTRRAERLLSEQCLAPSEGKCTVRPNSKISYDITRENGSLVCPCERFKLQEKCEHVLAVKLLYATPKPDGKAELSMLIADLKTAGMKSEDIDATLAKLCEGICEVSQLDASQIARAKHAFQMKLAEMSAVRQAA